MSWRGGRDDKPPHKLTQGELTRAISRFVHAHPIWPLGSRGRRGTSHMGYYRSDFEKTWARYCTQPKTPKHQNALAALEKSRKPRRKSRKPRKPPPRKSRKPPLRRKRKSTRRRHK